ncbi:uncharacterized protein G2W53_007298 [Senna tora]|uniref:Uncharacterized protein n=1 Tax=Senna tora TaxID=362788 RepID=A0A835CET5_9FABA|nr:uncharacterized protein G2W53_007298 [Senna tora]
MPPFTDIEIALLNYVGCAPSMMMPNSWTLVGGFEALRNFHRVEATVEAFFYFFQMNFPQKGSWDPPKDWKKDFFLVRPRRDCQPAWWLREDGTSLFPTKWVEPFEAIPRPVLRASSPDTQKTVRVLSALPPSLDIYDYFITDENGGKFNPARVLSLVKREEAKHGKNRSADRSGSLSAHQPRPRGDSRDGEPKKSHGKGHSSHSGGKGKASVSSGSKTSGLSSYKHRPEKDAELRSPSPKCAKVPAPTPESGGKEKELEQLRPEMASLRSSEQLLKVQLENAQKELKVWKDRSSALDEENRALRRAKEFATDGQRKLIADHSSLMGEYESLLQKFREASKENNIVDISTRAVLWKGPFDASQELSQDDMMEGTPSEALILEPSPSSPSILMSGKAIAKEASPGTSVQVAEGAEEGKGLSIPDIAGPPELSEIPQVESTVKELEAAELKPTAISEEFANSILAD